MADLCFKGPFHWEHLNELIQDKNSNINNHGIYIWGFVMRQDNNAQNRLIIKDFTDENLPPYKSVGIKLTNNSIFIPYYVGKVESKSIAKRLSEHRKVRSDKNSRKYTRLSIEYYSSFFNDPNFIPNTGNSNGKRCREIENLIWPNGGQNSNKITYQNCNEILNRLHNLSIPKKYKSNNKTEDYDYPITDYNIFPDTLRELVYCKNNFWFCYAELDNVGEKELQDYRLTLKKGSRSEFLKTHETQTFYSLKGKTISETLPFNPSGFGHTIKDKTNCDDIFKHKITGVIHCEDDFKGYLDNTLY